MLFEQSEEAPGVEGLGILKGKICRIPNAEGLKIPHMGWNSLHLENNGRLFKGIEDDPYVYFVHSYYLKAEDEQIVKASAEYGVHIHASVEQKMFCVSVSSGKEQYGGTSDIEKFRGIIRGECDVYKENYSLSGCKRRTGRKGVNFVGLKDAGDPVEIAKAYDAAGADELIFLDITASSDQRKR